MLAVHKAEEERVGSSVETGFYLELWVITILCSSSSHRVSVLYQSLTLPEWLSARVPLGSCMLPRQIVVLGFLSSFKFIQPLLVLMLLTSIKWASRMPPIMYKIKYVTGDY